MRLFIAILLGILCAAIDVSAQSIRLGERIPEISVTSEYGTKLEYAEKELMTLIFIHSESEPCIEAVQLLDPYLHEMMDIVLVTPESSEEHDAIVRRLGTSDFAIAFDNDGKTYRNFGINYVPFCVIYDTQRKRIEWFGPIEHLGNGFYCK